jgi:tetratricopeptide (TPR) repeat protein
MVGRERELEELNRELQAAMEGKGRTVLISAEAGIGKTRLVTEFLKSVKQENTIKLSGWCLQHAEIPYFPFIEAFSNYYSTLGERGGEEELEISAWLKGPAKTRLSDKLKYLSPQAIKDQTFAAVARAIHAIATEKPLILLIEDVHWADSASLALLHYLARAINDSERVLVLATFRSEELTTDSAGYPHHLVETLALMRREDLFKQINLPCLSANCVAEMAESMLGGCLERRLAEKLRVESEGNPLFVVESLRMLNEQDKLINDKNKWRLAADELGIPSKFKDIMLQRLACLNHVQRRLLDASSVIGEEFEVGLLSAVVEQDSLEVTEALNVIAHSTSLVRPDENRYRFDHARSREIIYESLSQPLKQAYHQKIAKTLENTKSKNLPFSELSHHYAQAGNNEKAVKYALEAGRDALLKWSNSEAVKHFEYALKNLPKGQDEVKKAALEGLGDAYRASCMYNEAIKTFDELAETATGTLRLHAIRKAMDAAYDQGSSPDLLLKYARKAEEVGGDDRLEMARIIDNRGRAWAYSGRGDARMDLADYSAALQVFEEEYSLADVAEGLCRSGLLSTYFIDSREKGLCQLLRSLKLFRELGDIRKELESRMWLAIGFQCCGLTPEALCEYSKVLEAGGKMGLFDIMAFACSQLSNIYSHSGKLEEALSIALKEIELCNKTDSSYRKGVACAQLAYLYSLNGNLEEADKYFNTLKKLLPTDVLSNEIHGFCSCLGVYFFAKGWLDKSDEAFRKAEEFYEKINLGSEIWFRLDFAWVLEKRGYIDGAKVQLSLAQKMRENLNSFGETKFGHSNLHLDILVPRYVPIGKDFEMRLELVNVAKNPGIIVKIEGLIPSNAEITSFPSFCRIQDDNLMLNQRKIDPFQVVIIKLRIKLSETGVYKQEPIVSYVDDLGTLRVNKANLISITTQLNPLEPTRVGLENNLEKLEFDSEAAEKAFHYLADTFRQDQFGKMPVEKSGWRTLMQVMRDAKVTKNDLYGRSGRGGKIIPSLEQMGLIETKYFSGERGRGGQVLKVRVRRQIIEK